MRTLPYRAAVLAALALAPVLVIANGYLPHDDALRHVAKAVAGRPWSDILVLRPEIALDSNPGWHVLLAAVHRVFGLGTVDLVIFSVVSLWLAFSFGPMLLLRRPESWLLALVLIGVIDLTVPCRLMIGRPFLLSSAIVPLFVLLWPRLEGPRPAGTLVLFTLCGLVSCWMHGSYYLLALPVLALAAARRWRAAGLLGAAFAIGTVAGALLTGHPLGHLWQMALHGYLALGRTHASSVLVTEFQPFDGRSAFVIATAALLALRWRRGEATAPWRDPAAVLILACWMLGYVAIRFWMDWSVPAFLALAALEIQDALERRVDLRGPARAVVASASAAALLLAMRADVQGRWSKQPEVLFLSDRNPTHRPWLPGRGGIAYSADMWVFYGLFFTNPQAPWRYVLGFEPAIMRDEDYKVLTEIRSSHGLTESYLPWLRRMRPEDRFYIMDHSNQQPPVPGLEWFQPVFGIWAGRLPKTAAGSATRPAFVAVPLIEREAPTRSAAPAQPGSNPAHGALGEAKTRP